MTTFTSHSNFTFQAQELPEKLSQVSQGLPTGYWHFEFSVPHSNRTHSWYLALSQKQVIFSGNQQLTWKSLLIILRRYLSHLRHDDVRDVINNWQQKLILERQGKNPISLLNLLDELCKAGMLSYPDLEQALRLKILSDFDTYLFTCSGQAQFLPSPQINLHLPITGFDLDDLLAQTIERQACWNKLKNQIPAMDSSPVLTLKAVESKGLTAEQKHRLEFLVSSGKTISGIAFALAQDELDVAKVFARLISEGWIKLKTFSDPPEIFVIDDSPILLKQFKNLVATWGYVVKSFDDPVDAMKNLLASQPTAIFVDINMPNLSGFDLVKQIRRYPEIASVPLIMLTAEKTLSNNWRSRWSGCRFLAKPLTVSEVPEFQLELRKLLLELVTFQRNNQFDRSTDPSHEGSNRWTTV